MPLSPNFEVTQPIGEPSVVRVTDTSTGSDVAITQRRVYLRKWDGTFLVPSGTSTDYIQWPLASVNIDIDALDKDYGLDVVVQWLNVSNVVLYDKTESSGQTSYNEEFDYDLTRLLAANPLLINDNNFQENKSNLRTFIDSGDQAIERYSDIYAAQLCYDRATELRINSQYSFNASS